MGSFCPRILSQRPWQVMSSSGMNSYLHFYVVKIHSKLRLTQSLRPMLEKPCTWPHIIQSSLHRFETPRRGDIIFMWDKWPIVFLIQGMF